MKYKIRKNEILELDAFDFLEGKMNKMTAELQLQSCGI